VPPVPEAEVEFDELVALAKQQIRDQRHSPEALIIALSRRLAEVRDNQAKRVWRGMISEGSSDASVAGNQLTLLIDQRWVGPAKSADGRGD
jgi:hypothetical protein